MSFALRASARSLGFLIGYTISIKTFYVKYKNVLYNHDYEYCMAYLKFVKLVTVQLYV